MAEIEIELCGHQTTIACAPEDAPRVRQLVALIAEHVDQARGITGDGDRWRQLLFAAIFMAEKIDSETENDKAASPAVASGGPGIALEVERAARRIAALADRLEGLLAGPPLEPVVRNA